MGDHTIDRRLRVPILVGVALAVLAALAISLSLTAAGGDEARAQAIDPEIEATLGAFRRERRAQDELPGDPVATLRRTGDAQPGEDPSLSRRVDVAGSIRPAFLWPMASGVCYSAPRGGSGCIPIARIRGNGVEVAVNSAIRRKDLRYLYVRVFGITRDGVTAVTLGFAGGREVQAEVHDNVFFADLSDMPDEVRWQDSRGSHSEPIAGGFDSLEEFRSP